MSKTSILMVASAAVICAALLILGLAVIFFAYPFERPLPFAAGLGMGFLHTVFKIVTLEKSIQKTVDLEKDRAVAMARLLTFARMGITVAVFVLVILFPRVFGLFGAIAGVVSLQLSAYATNILIRKDTSI